MLTNLTDLRKGLRLIMSMERQGKWEEASKHYEETFKPSLAIVGEKMGKTPDEVRALLQATPSRRRVDFN